MTKIITIPALIDPHVHFRTPGGEHKEDFASGAEAAFYGGVRYVLDMPNTSPATTTEETLDWKIKQTEGGVIPRRNDEGSPPEQDSIRAGRDSSSVGMTKETGKVHFDFHFGATSSNMAEIKKVNDKIKSVKVYFGSSTGDLLVNKMDILEKITQITDKILTVHAEDEDIIVQNTLKYRGISDPSVHSKIRNTESATVAVKKLLELVRKTNHPMYFCHLSTKEEVELIRVAKKEGLPVFAEVTPHHLFLDESEYEKQGNFVKVNPPLRTIEDREALWEGINDGTIDTVGSDHAPHLPEEKRKLYSEAPSGMPGVETTLPLMLNAVNEGKLTLEKMIELTHENPKKIFGLKLDETIEVDMDLVKEVQAKDLHSKCGWSPYEGMELKGGLVIRNS